MSGHQDLYKEIIKEEPIEPIKRKKLIAEQLLNTFLTNRFFAKSNPPIDLEYVEALLELYDIAYIKEQIKKMNLWLLDRKPKTRYKQFITNWMLNKDRKYYLK
jgi:hypothetical protein